MFYTYNHTILEYDHFISSFKPLYVVFLFLRVLHWLGHSVRGWKEAGITRYLCLVLSFKVRTSVFHPLTVVFAVLSLEPGFITLKRIVLFITRLKNSLYEEVFHCF